MSIFKNPFFRVGVPMVVFLTSSTYGLSIFLAGKHKIEDRKADRRSMTTRQYDIEQDYEKTMKKLNPDYELIPIKRPKGEEVYRKTIKE